VYELPAIEHAATVIHHGAFDGLGKAYDALHRWISSNGYTIIGAQREINLQYERNGDPTHYVTEIQFPVMKSAG
jgi:effector-binding domain-containing protein